MTPQYPPYPYDFGSQPMAPDVNRSDRRRIWQLITGIAAFGLAQLSCWLVVSPLMLVTGGSPAPVTALLGMCVAAAVAVVAYLVIMRFIAGTPGLGLRGSETVTEFAIGLGFGLLLAVISLTVIALLGGYRVTGAQMTPGILTVLALAIGPAFMEEVLFRGILLRLLDAWLGSWAALAISSLLFGAAHFGNPSATLWGACAIALEAGLVLGAAYLLTRRLWLAIGIHLMWNFSIGGIFGSPLSGLDAGMSSVFTAEFSGPVWLTGGSMGVEASVVTVIVFLLTAGGMLLLAGRHGMILGPDRSRKTSGKH